MVLYAKNSNALSGTLHTIILGSIFMFLVWSINNSDLFYSFKLVEYNEARNIGDTELFKVEMRPGCIMIFHYGKLSTILDDMRQYRTQLLKRTIQPKF